MNTMEAMKKLLTYAGLKALEEELENLKVVKRKEVAAKIKEAREQGDLSENAEYDAANVVQRDWEARIEELEAILKNAEGVVEDEGDFDKINVGCTVKAYDITFDEDIEFIKSNLEDGEALGFVHYNQSVIDSDRANQSPYDVSEETRNEIRAIKNRLLEIEAENKRNK